MLVNIDKYYYTSKKEASEYMGMMSNVVGNNIVNLDLSENFEYKDTKRERARNESRINYYFILLIY